MDIILLKDKLDNGQVKTTVSRRRGTAIAWFKGKTITVSDETGKKLIANGEAEAAPFVAPVDGADLDEQSPERQAALIAAQRSAGIIKDKE